MADETTTDQTTEKNSSGDEKTQTIATSAVQDDANADQGGDAGKGDEAEGDGKGDTKGKSEETAPIKYAEFKLPDGFELKGDDLEKVSAFFSEKGLDQETAQAMIDFDINRRLELAEEAKAQKEEQVQGWAKEVTDDPNLGGRFLPKTQQACARALYAFDVDGSLTGLLNETGLGNHPAVVRYLAALGAQIREDNAGDKGGYSQGNPLASMYPSMFGGE